MPSSNSDVVLFDVKKAGFVHLLCFALHITSTIVIAALALKNGSKVSDYHNFVNKDLFAFTSWNIYCYDSDSKSYTVYDEKTTTNAECPDDTRLFTISKGKNVFETPVNILFLALSFTSVSAFVHGVSAALCCASLTCFKGKFRYTMWLDSMLRFSVDYAISAPIMLSLVNIVFGANSVSGVIAGPALLFVLLEASSLLLRIALDNKEYSNISAKVAFYAALAQQTRKLFPFAACFKAKTWYIVSFVVLILLYGVSLAPTIVAIREVGSLAPKAIIIFMVGFLLAYSSFIWPYGRELFSKKRYGYFLTYAVLSLIAKAILHSFLAISVLQQADLYSNAEIDFTKTDHSPPPDMATQNRDAFAIIFGAPAVGIILALVLNKYCNPITVTIL